MFVVCRTADNLRVHAGLTELDEDSSGYQTHQVDSILIVRMQLVLAL